MKIHDTTTKRCFACQHPARTTLRTNKIFFITVLFALAFFPSWENAPDKQTGRIIQLVPSAYGVQFSMKEPSPPLEEQDLVTDTAPASSEENRIANSATCGRPWQKKLTQVQGRIRTIEYRAQPTTGRKGLHIDVETNAETNAKKHTVIHVYPETLTAKCPSVFQFTVGDKVTVKGSEFFTGRGGVQQNICAAIITQEEKTLGVRNPVTGNLERQLCCQVICEKNCTGLPSMCDRMCMGNCKNEWMKTALQGAPFCPSCEKDYATTTFDF